MNKKNDAIVPAIIRAWREKYKDDPTKLSRGKLQEAKPGHGTAKYIEAQKQLQLELCAKEKEPNADPLQALTTAAQTIQSIKLILQQNANEIAKLIKEKYELKETIKRLEHQIDELSKFRDEASGGKGAKAPAVSSPRKKANSQKA